MVPRPQMRRDRNNDFSAVGKVGRRTGITVPQGRLDENGLEEMSALFSSPLKPSPMRRQVNGLNDISEISMLEVSEAMTGMDSTGLTPIQVLSTRKSLRGTSIPPPRSSSPRKTGISGSARRSNGVDILSFAKDLPTIDLEDCENTPMLSPTCRAQSNVRRFSPTPEKSPLREVTTNGLASSKLAKGNQRAIETLPTRPINYIVVDMAGHGETQQSMGGVPQHEEGIDFTPNGDDSEAILNGSLGSATELRPQENNERMYESIEIEQLEEMTPKFNEKSHRGGRKRKSESLEEESEVSSGHSPQTQPAKRARIAMIKETKLKSTKAIDHDFPLDATLGSETRNMAKGRPVGKTKNQNPLLTSQQETELGQIIERVRARPGQQKSLYILRRETPADNSAVHTRSGRVSVKPLAYWRNERCVYGGSPSSANLTEGARFPLNSIKEIIRTEELETSRSQSPSKSKGKGKKSKSRSQATTIKKDMDSDSDSADPEWIDQGAEEWEASSGIYRGDVSMWDQNQQAPLESLEEVELAYAPVSIQTREVKSMHTDQRTFKFAKLLSTSFFGSGIVELAPGDLKRPKNSRKMHMSFFVAKGRVTVEVGSLGGEMSRFSVGKGGFWQVPRGNQYSIENELDRPAKIFFSQACEPMPMMLED